MLFPFQSSSLLYPIEKGSLLKGTLSICLLDYMRAAVQTYRVVDVACLESNYSFLAGLFGCLNEYSESFGFFLVATDINQL